MSGRAWMPCGFPQVPAGRASSSEQGSGIPPGLLVKIGAERAGRRLGLLDHALGRVRPEHDHRARRATVVGDVGAAHVGTQCLVAGEVVGVGQGALRVLLRPDDVLQHDVRDVVDVPDRRQVGEQVTGHDGLAGLPLVLHVVRLTLHPERRRNLHEVDDLAVVVVRRAVDVAPADVDHHHGVEAAEPLLGADIEDTGRTDRALVDEPHPVVAAHVADVVLAGPHHRVLRLAVGRGVGTGGFELGDGQVPSLQGTGDQVLCDLGYVVGVIDGLDTLPRESECRFHGVRTCVTGGHAGIDAHERERAEDHNPFPGPPSEAPHVFPLSYV